MTSPSRHSRPAASADRGEARPPGSGSASPVGPMARFYRTPHSLGVTATTLQAVLLTAAAAIVLDAGPATAGGWLWWLPAFAFVSAIGMVPLTALWFLGGFLSTVVARRRAGAGASSAGGSGPSFRHLSEHGKARVHALTAFWRRACRAATGPLLLGAAFLAARLLDPAAPLPFSESAPAFLALPILGWPFLAAALLTVTTPLAGTRDGLLRQTLLDRAQQRLPLLVFTPPGLFLAAWLFRGRPWDGFSGWAAWLAAGVLAAPWIALAALPALAAALLLGWLLLAVGDALLRFWRSAAEQREPGAPRAAPGRPFRAMAAPFLAGDPYGQSGLVFLSACLLVAFLGAAFDLWPADFAHYLWAVPLAGLAAAGVSFPLTATWWAAGLLLTLVDVARGVEPPHPADEAPAADRPSTPTREHLQFLRAAGRARFGAMRESSVAIGALATGLLVLVGTVRLAIFSFREIRASNPALSAWDALLMTAIAFVALFVLLAVAFVVMKTAQEIVERLLGPPRVSVEVRGELPQRTNADSSR